MRLRAPLTAMCVAAATVLGLLAEEGECTNYGLRYDGVDDVLWPAYCLPIGRDNPFTIEVWLLRRPGGGTWEEIGRSRGFSFFVHTSSRLYLNVATPGTQPAPECCHLGTFADYTRYRGDMPVPIGSWVHIAVVWDGVQPVAYINGAPDPMVFDLNQHSFSCCEFGDAAPCYTPDAPRTTIDEVRVWTIPRTRAEIVATMFSLLSGNEPGLLAYWPMDEGSGQSTADGAGTNDLQLGTSPNPDIHDPSWTVTDWLPPTPVESDTWGAIKSAFR